MTIATNRQVRIASANPIVNITGDQATDGSLRKVPPARDGLDVQYGPRHREEFNSAARRPFGPMSRECLAKTIGPV